MINTFENPAMRCAPFRLIPALASFLLLVCAVNLSAADDQGQTKYGVDLMGYFFSDDHAHLLDRQSSNLAFAVDMTLAHDFSRHVGVDFAATAFANALDDGIYSGIGRYFEDAATGVFLNKANLQLSACDTTLVLGRDTLATPLFQSLDWLLGPAAFDVISVRNNSLEGIELYAAYVIGWRRFNGGNNWTNLTDISGESNWMLHAGFSDEHLKANLWYYDVDIGDTFPGSEYAYNQVYADTSRSFKHIELCAQFVYTGWQDDDQDDSVLAAVKATGTLGTVTLIGAYQYIWNSPVGYIEADSLYATTWGTFSAASMGHNLRFAVNRQLFDVLDVTLSTAWFQYDQYEDSGHEFDLILTWQALEAMNVNLDGLVKSPIVTTC
jgi:hypothetical protein